MNKEEFYKEILNNLGIILTEEQKRDLELFANLLLEYNKHTNITAIRDINGVYLKHFYDSLTLVKVFDFTERIEVLDLGSGGGFPGIVLAIVFPNLNITLLDANHKKSDFQKYIVDNLKLDNVNVINDRAENYFKLGKKYDLVVARAVANLPILSELCIPFVKLKGHFIAMKGDSLEEIEKSIVAIKFLGGVINKKCEFSLKDNKDLRILVVIEKIKESPQGYPRVYDKIIKKPLQ